MGDEIDTLVVDAGMAMIDEDWENRTREKACYSNWVRLERSFLGHGLRIGS